jgi:ABC-2 type transport system permease protein
MSLTAIHALVRNDLRVYRTDRRALVIGILVPILVAAFFGYVFGGNGNSTDPGKIPIGVVDEDHSEVSRAIAADLARDPMLAVRMLTRTDAQTQVRAGSIQAAAILPKAFGDGAAKALFTSRDKPAVLLLVDPSQPTTARIVQGLFAQYGMQEITKAAFSGPSGQAALSSGLDWVKRASPDQVPEHSELQALLESAQALMTRTSKSDSAATSGLQRGLSIPYDITTTAMTSARNIPYNGYAHSFAGMTIQFILFTGIDAGVLLLLAAIGRSAGATRGIAMMVILLLVMLGGAWVPAFVFPQWLQQVSLAAPTRWAVDGLDAMTWRGLGFATAVTPLMVLAVSALLCMLIAIWRFRWED